MNGSAPRIAPAFLARPVSALWGVGPERAAHLERLGIRQVEDLLLHRPRRYEDRRHFRRIADLQLHEPAVTRGKIQALGLKWFKRHTKSIFEIILDDGTARLHCRWWNLPFMEKYFATGDEVVVFGKPLLLKPRTIDHPETEVVEGGEESQIHLNRITPIYPLTEGVTQRWLRALIWRTLQQSQSHIAEPWPQLAGRITLAIGGRPLPSRAEAIRLLHFPNEPEDAELARRRLALDEFIELQRQVRQRRLNFESKAAGLPAAGDNRLIKPFLAQLGFKLTPAQTRVLRELRHDLAGRHPMRRLLQGDVGSGKTVVAACCALMAIESGYTAVLMAPTEILAEQHHRTFARWLEPLGVPVELRTATHRSEPLTRPLTLTLSRGERGPQGERGLVIGTHALLTPGFEIPDLGLVIIDEQHKFGAAQREQLVRKGRYPHLLIMTATPIPRSLGLTLYGEMDVSVIDELPPGRGRVRTFVRGRDKLPEVWSFIRDKLTQGRQAYVVYPRVEETGAAGIKAVTKEFEVVQRAMAPFQVGLVHGRLTARQKEAVMESFRSGATKVLMATSLIEVGVDVANATMMLIENAEQFGLAQLHQLRGRIGRGGHESFCILVSAGKGETSAERLRALEQTQDGFEIAEADLKLRGPGELLGHQQSGSAGLRFGELSGDWDLIVESKRLAGLLVESGTSH